VSTTETVFKSRQLTVGEDGDIPTLSKDACRKDAKDQEHGTSSGPPANKVTNKIDLLVTLIHSPETNALLGEWP